MSTNFTIFSIEFIYHTTRFKAFDGMPHSQQTPRHSPDADVSESQ